MNIVAIVPLGTDPEAAAIAGLCQQAGIPVHRPMCQGKPVHTGNAYKADAVEPPIPADALVLRVECDGPALAGIPAEPLVVIDHHRPGDPGYSRRPADFLAGSSLGQVIVWLARQRKLPVHSASWHCAGDAADSEAGRLLYAADGRVANNGNDFQPPGWIVCQCEPTPDSEEPLPRYWRIPDALVYTAAADHCLAAAYRGACPGVDPEKLLVFRCQQKAEFQGVPLDTILGHINRARELLRKRSLSPQGLPRPYADLTAEPTVPELPEAAAREGIAFLAKVADRDGRQKVVLQAASAELVRAFLAGEVYPGLVNHYGDPERGFAGGYER